MFMSFLSIFLFVTGMLIKSRKIRRCLLVIVSLPWKLHIVEGVAGEITDNEIAQVFLYLFGVLALIIVWMFLAPYALLMLLGIIVREKLIDKGDNDGKD